MAQSSKTGLVLGVGLGLIMLLLSFASVPLYRMFCQQTGFGGTPKVGTLQAGTRVGKRQFTIRFNADVNGLPWSFKPLQLETTIRPGEQALAFYHAKNLSNQTQTGMAIYNVVPDKAGAYFNKVDCFCFMEQRFKPGQAADMPVVFFLDPAIEEDPNLREVKTITLSYTFFELKK